MFGCADDKSHCELTGRSWVVVFTVHELVIEPGRAEKNYCCDLWRYRELFYFLAWRDILVRYKQTVIGIAWALVRPLLTMIVFTFVFSKIAKLPAPGSVPYGLMVFAAMLPWQFFSTALSESSNRLIVQFGLYVSPVGFSSASVPEKWRLLYSLNPMVGVIDGFRWALLRGESPLSISSLVSSISITVVLCATGTWYFRRTEKTFADVI